MLKKRLIFVLYFADGFFYLSRNFRLQKAGDVLWLLNRFKFESVGRHIDELVLLDVSRNNADDPFSGSFWEAAAAILRRTFTPLSVGGGIRKMEDVRRCFEFGADKVIVNTALATDPDFVRQCVRAYGSQAIIAGVGIRHQQGEFSSFVRNGSEPFKPLAEHLAHAGQLGVGEIYVNSIDRDGTGVGFDLSILSYLDAAPMPIILSGGAGKPQHFAEVLADPRVSAVATGNLFNFIGDGFNRVRRHLVEAGLPVRQ